MKKISFLFLLIINIGCVNSSEKITTIKGGYLFFDDAAVLQTDHEIYGVYMSEKALELNKRAAQLQATDSEMIYVELKGIISTEKHEKILWEKKFDVKKIISVKADKKPNNTLILGTN